MPSKLARIEQVANQMMKGGQPGKIIATDNQKAYFEKRHRHHIFWALNNLPRSSSAVPAIIVKCLIKYDHNRVIEFCKALRSGFFQGQDDPAFLLWRFLQSHRGPDTIAIYQKTVYAARAYMEHRKISCLRPAKEDIFTWDEDWTVPDDLLSNWKPDRILNNI